MISIAPVKRAVAGQTVAKGTLPKRDRSSYTCGMSVDYLVIGAGVVGLSTAYHLKRAEPSARVLVLEQKSRICSGNSARSAALYRNLFSSSTSRALAESSITYYESIAAEIALKANGYLWGFSRAAWKASEAAIRKLAAELRSAQILEGAALRDLIACAQEDEPPFAAPYAALFSLRCGSLSAMALAEHYAARLRERGGQILTGRAAVQFLFTEAGEGAAPWERENFRAVVDSSGERHDVGRIVAAAGCWLQDLLGPAGVATGIYPKKRQLFGLRIEDPSLILAPEIEAGRAPNIILPTASVYLKPILDRGLLLVGCADDLGRPFELPYAPAEAAKPEEAYFRSVIEPVLRAAFPRLAAAHPEPLELATSWAGHYDYYWPDRNPVVEIAGNLVWVGGSSGSGIMKADAIGRIAAARARGKLRAELADGTWFNVSDLSLRTRAVAPESLVI